MKHILHIYTRVSSAVQEEGTSLETQKELGIKKSKELGMKYQISEETFYYCGKRLIEDQ